MQPELPVVFLAFANAPDDHLAMLKDESRDVFRALQPLERDGRIAVHREESARLDELYRDLLAYDERIVIFHYGGHADGDMLQLEGGVGGAGGIAGLLGQQTSLKLVFLNGCATRAQVKLLHAAGVPAVIATAVKISDSKATSLSKAFYAALAEGQSIPEAFDYARHYIEGKGAANGGSTLKINRYPNYDFSADEASEEDEPYVFEWALYTREECAEDLEQWRLPEAREGWRTQLEDSRGAIRTPAGEPLLIEHRWRSRTLEALRCEQCGTVSSGLECSVICCPVCGSESTQKETARTAIPASCLPCTVTEEEARAIAREALGPEYLQLVQLKLVNIPYWFFDIATSTTLTAERGTVKAFDTDSLDLEWEEVNDQVELELDSFPVLAGTVPAVAGVPPPDWHWNMQVAQPLRQFEPGALYVPLELSIEAGFAEVSRYLAYELEAEVFDRIGGHQQRNIATDMRYKSVTASTVALPHWCATANSENGRASVLINGQTGTTRFPHLNGMNRLAGESDRAMNKQVSDHRSGAGSTSVAVSVFSGVGMGLMVGLLMGLAAPADPGAKTVVGIFIGAVGVGLAALLGLNDRHFSNAKGLRIGSFGLAVALSALTGIYVRDHGLVSPGLEQRVQEIKGVFPGIGNDEVIELLAMMDAGVPAGQDGVRKISVRSMQYSGVAADQTVCDKLTAMRDDEASSALVLRNFRHYDAGDEFGWRTLADKAGSLIPAADLKSFLLVSRDAICGNGVFDDRVSLPPSQCARLLAQGAAADWRAGFAAGGSSAAALAVIENKLSSSAQVPALQLLGPALCSAPKENNK